MKSAILSALIGCGAVMAASAPSSVKISGPYVHENLSIFLIHSSAAPAVDPYVTLEKAMGTGNVVVYETNQVNELAVENVSNNPVFIQGGDIVKGGKQDRVITNDFVLPAKSGRVAVSAFCVEQGRWSRRGSESTQSFSAVRTMLPGKEIKQAAMLDKNQQKVWEEVPRNRPGSHRGWTGSTARTEVPRQCRSRASR